MTFIMQKANKNSRKAKFGEWEKWIEGYFRKSQQDGFIDFLQSFQSTCLNTIWV